MLVVSHVLDNFSSEDCSSILCAIEYVFVKVTCFVTCLELLSVVGNLGCQKKTPLKSVFLRICLNMYFTSASYLLEDFLLADFSILTGSVFILLNSRC